MKIYKISDAYSDMSAEEIYEDVSRFYIQYIRNKNIEDIGPDDISDVFSLYLFRYLEYADKSFDISLN